jgi:hypothetical protein
MSSRLARRLVRLYPRAWRARYEDEFVALVETRDSGWLDSLDIIRGAAHEWLRLTRTGRALGIAFEAWTAAVVWSLIIASIGSLIVGVGRFLMGFESTLILPFRSVELARSFVVEMPAAIALAAMLAAPWFALCRWTGLAERMPIFVRLVSLVSSFAMCAWFVFSAEQLTGVFAAGWVLSAHVLGARSPNPLGLR